MKKILLPIIFALIGGCVSSAQRKSTLASRENIPASNADIGCRPSEGECKMSCPERDGIATLDPERCTFQREPYFCRCGGIQQQNQDMPVLEPSEGTHTFIGCRRDSYECQTSCPRVNGLSVPGSPRCAGQLNETIACFCPR